MQKEREKIRRGRERVYWAGYYVKEEWQKEDSRGMCECTGTVGY